MYPEKIRMQNRDNDLCASIHNHKSCSPVNSRRWKPAGEQDL